MSRGCATRRGESVSFDGSRLGAKMGNSSCRRRLPCVRLESAIDVGLCSCCCRDIDGVGVVRVIGRIATTRAAVEAQKR